MFKSIITKCRPNYNWLDDDTKHYNVSWEKLPNVTSKNEDETKKEKCKTPWCYQVNK